MSTEAVANRRVSETQLDNPRRRPLSQMVGPETEDSIYDLYSSDNRRSVEFPRNVILQAPLSTPKLVPKIGDGDSYNSSNNGERGENPISRRWRSQSGAQSTDASTPNMTEPEPMFSTKGSPPEPESWGEETAETFFSRHRRKLLLTLILVSVLAIILVFFFYPRKVLVAVKQIRPAGPDQYSLTMANDELLGIEVADYLETLVQNPNFAPIKIRRALVEGFWIVNNERRLIGNGTVTNEKIGARTERIVKLPFNIDHMADPRKDPIYQDFLTKCIIEEKKMIDMEYLVKLDLRYIGNRFQRALNYSYKVPCPISPINIAKILQASHFDLKTMKLSDGSTLQNVLDQDSKDETN